MRFKLNIPEYSVKKEVEYTSDVLKEKKNFPVLTIGRDSYIEEVIVDNVLDKSLVYSVQVGRYSAIAHDVTFVVDMNHDYKKVCQGRISGVDYQRPKFTKRKGHIHIMNDCWIGEHATILSGVTIENGAVVSAEAVVTKDVPAYAVVAGNPAKIIGYRFNQDQIDKLSLIRWWNWTEEKVRACAHDLYGDIDKFIEKHIKDAVKDLTSIEPVKIIPMEKAGCGEDKILLYIPDFEQDYPTYPQVIDAFVKSYAGTNTELLLYLREDEFLEDKLALLNEIFAQYEDVECYVNLYIGNVIDERGLFGQVDAYITNRNLDNITHVDMADLFGLPVISSVNRPIFEEYKVSGIEKAGRETNEIGLHNSNTNSKKKVNTDENCSSQKDILKLMKAMKSQNGAIVNLQQEMEQAYKHISQLSANQYAMNCSVNNLKYEMFAGDTDPIYPTVLDGDKAIDLIINEGKSMSRFGDGEFAVIAGDNRQKFQRADKALGMRLKDVLNSKQDNLLICIADTYGDLSKYNDDCRYNIRAYMSEQVRKEHYELLDMNRTYYDTYVTRPYASYIDNNTDAPRKRFDKLRRIWEGRKLLIIEGEKTRMGVGNDLFDNALDIKRILGPAVDAFDRYDDILEVALKQDKDRLVLIAMGATATVLAHDLSKEGYQALDIGHIDIEYEWMLAGKGKKTQVKTKYNNEVAGGDIVLDVKDPVYESQIIARIY